MRFREAVRARYGRVTAAGEEAVFDGEETMVLSGGTPRVTDDSLMEIEGSRVVFGFRETARLEVDGGVSARFAPDRLDWLPGKVAAAGVTSDTALMEGESGQGTFQGAVRLLFGANLLGADTLDVDAEAGLLRASGRVANVVCLRTPRPRRRTGRSSLPTGMRRPPTRPPRRGREKRTARLPGPRSPSVSRDAPSSFSYDAATARFSYRGSPRIEQEQEEARTLVRAARVIGELESDGALAAVIGEIRARFERSPHRVSGARIRYEPGSDRLHAWGSPAVADFEGKTTRGGRLELDFGEDRSEVYPSHSRRAFVEVTLGDRAGEDGEEPPAARERRPR